MGIKKDHHQLIATRHTTPKLFFRKGALRHVLLGGAIGEREGIAARKIK